MVRTILIVLVIFLLIVVLIPTFLGLVGIDIIPSGSKGGTSSVSGILLRSGNSGEEWKSVNFSGSRFPSAIFDITFHPANPSVMFVGTKSAGIWKSGDAGLNWEQMNDRAGVLQATSDVYKVAISRSHPEHMYAAVFQGGVGRILKSEDSGESFREIYFATVKKFGVFDLAVDPFDGNSVYAATGQGLLLHSSDGGKTWRVAKTFGEPLTTIVMNPTLPRELYVATSRGKVFKTLDGATSWTAVHEAITRVEGGRSGYVETPESPLAALRDSFSPVTLPLVIDPHNPATLYFGSETGLLRSESSGIVWEKLDTLFAPQSFPPRGIAVHPKNPQTIFVAAGKELERSDNRGSTWSGKVLPIETKVKKLFISPSDPKVMLIIVGK